MSTSDRRSFLSSVIKGTGLAVTASMFDLASLRTVVAAPQAGKIEIPVWEHPELKAPGGAILLDSAELGGKIVVARLDEKSFVAVSAKCTHKACSVDFDAENKRFECPCHGSQYNLDGTVAHGPATRDLEAYTATYASDVVTVCAKAPAGAASDSTKTAPDTTKK